MGKVKTIAITTDEERALFFKCPVCENRIPLSGMFFLQYAGDKVAKPHICIGCVRAFYHGSK